MLAPRSLQAGNLPEGERVRVVYILPVEEGSGIIWGDPLKACRDAKVLEQHSAVLVFPEFEQLPWYADHPTDKTIAQESYLIKSVIPAVEEKLGFETTKCDRYLLGFSKSGWGAFSLILRHPGLFQKAAAWDAPLMMDAPGKYGSGPIFRTHENFQKYHVTSLLKRTTPQEPGTAPRLISIGYGNFREHHLEIHELLTTLKIPHIHKDGPQHKHHWESGWVKDAVDLLLAQPSQ
ncbi:MAG: alpha/beta hydrolase-fold protein [Planctomycetaceae bacterium]|nr:alpha/beta hydrolase-fold protein [Planctomycetaceae bacterium]MDG2391360.1 alpha/beta hydrolase-fold protein [Planctomycetaceae bacterium]